LKPGLSTSITSFPHSSIKLSVSPKNNYEEGSSPILLIHYRYQKLLNNYLILNYGNYYSKICFRSIFSLLLSPMNEELQNLLSKVRSLYKKYGIKSVTMDDVARELGISKKTLYQYVNDKNELVQKVIEMELNDRALDFTKMCCPGLNAIEEIFEVHKLVQQMLKDYNPSTEYDLRKYYPELHAQIIKVRRARIYDNTLANLAKGKAEGLYRTELNDELIAKLQLSRVESAFDDKIFTQDELLSAKLFLEMFIYHIRGIANEKGLTVLEQKLREIENNNN